MFGSSVPNLLTLSGLWTLFSRFVTLGLATSKNVHKSAKVSRFVTSIGKVSINLPRLAGL